MYDPTDIVQFRGPTRWLSNFHHAPIVYDGVIYPTTEHFYQSYKSPNPDEQIAIIDCKTPLEAMHMGRSTKETYPPEIWETMKVLVMFNALMLKFTQHSDLKSKLINTGKVQLVEGNTWGDRVWGQCPLGEGENLLGKTLMKVRTILQENY